MNLAGRTTVGGATYELVSNTKRSMRFSMPADAMVSKVSVYLDGMGSGAAGLLSQAAKLILYDSAGNLLWTSNEVVVAVGQAPGWVDFLFATTNGAPLDLDQGIYQGAVLAGGPATNLIRVYGDDPHGAGGSTNSDSYADGGANPFGASTALTADMSMFLTYFAPYSTVLPNETDLYYSRLPFPEAQAVFSSGGPTNPGDGTLSLVGATRLTNVGWHGTFIDPEMGSNALVRQGSPLEGLLGERIMVVTVGTSKPRTVFAYVHNVVQPTELDWDLSLTRHLYAQIALLASDPVLASVMVLS